MNDLYYTQCYQYAVEHYRKKYQNSSFIDAMLSSDERLANEAIAASVVLNYFSIKAIEEALDISKNALKRYKIEAERRAYKRPFLDKLYELKGRV